MKRWWKFNEKFWQFQTLAKVDTAMPTEKYVLLLAFIVAIFVPLFKLLPVLHIPA
jgi:hypothetical protein